MIIFLTRVIGWSPFFAFICCALSHVAIAQLAGCTDPLASNFNALAVVNDGSCSYPISTIQPLQSWDLPTSLNETSGLIQWNDSFWSHNDNSDVSIHQIDTGAVIVETGYPLQSVSNVDWEEISQDAQYFYIADVGNNSNGNRTDLRIYRLLKDSLQGVNQVVDTIFFSYEDQVDFTPSGANNTDFDCEAFVVSSDSIFLFTKQWVSSKTAIYAIPKFPGTYVAQKQGELNVNGLITGAVLLENQDMLLLCGYSSLLQPFMWLMYDFQSTNFFNGNKRKFNINLPFHQIEAISTIDGKSVFCSNEQFQQSFVTVDQQLHQFDLSVYTQAYLEAGLSANDNTFNVEFFPNPSFDRVIQLRTQKEHYPIEIQVINQIGSVIKSVQITHSDESISCAELNAGVYHVQVNSRLGSSKRFKWILF
jgi:hypothetical protein